MRDRDRKMDGWDMKDLVGKKQAIMYGRSINHYFADAVKKRYRPHLEAIDVYDFLIDPACGGSTLKRQTTFGSYSIMLNKKELYEGKRDGYFRKDVTKRLFEGSGNADDFTQEETNKQPRADDQRTIGRKRTESKDIYKFWRWYTTFEGERVHADDHPGDVIRCEWLPDVLPVTEDYDQGMWPFWSYAAFPDLTEFWTPSYCDFIREILMAQDVTVNQALDNAEAINKPMKVVNVDAIENLSELSTVATGRSRSKATSTSTARSKPSSRRRLIPRSSCSRCLKALGPSRQASTMRRRGLKMWKGRSGSWKPMRRPPLTALVSSTRPMPLGMSALASSTSLASVTT